MKPDDAKRLQTRLPPTRAAALAGRRRRARRPLPPPPRRRPATRGARRRCSASPAWCCSPASPTAPTGRWCSTTTSRPTTPTCRATSCSSRRRSSARSSRSPPTTPTSSRPASRWCASTRPTRGSRSSRPRRSSRRRCAKSRTLFVNNGALRAQIAAREADLARAQSDLARAEEDVARRAPLVATGAVGKEEFNHVTAQVAVAKTALSAAESGAQAAREQLASNQSLTEGISVEQHPNVLRAAAGCARRYLALARTELVGAGRRLRRAAQRADRPARPGRHAADVGDRRSSDVWVDANFKEGQLRNLRIGQPVKLDADVYGEKVEYHGRIDGLGAGTGAAFALLPAQNATGNWIKVVQRVPVRDRARSRRKWPSIRCASACRWTPRSTCANTDGRMLADALAARLAGEDRELRRGPGRGRRRRAADHRRQPRPRRAGRASPPRRGRRPARGADRRRARWPGPRPPPPPTDERARRHRAGRSGAASRRHPRRRPRRRRRRRGRAAAADRQRRSCSARSRCRWRPS